MCPSATFSILNEEKWKKKIPTWHNDITSQAQRRFVFHHHRCFSLYTENRFHLYAECAVSLGSMISSSFMIWVLNRSPTERQTNTNTHSIKCAFNWKITNLSHRQQLSHWASTYYIYYIFLSHFTSPLKRDKWMKVFAVSDPLNYNSFKMHLDPYLRLWSSYHFCNHFKILDNF